MPKLINRRSFCHAAVFVAASVLSAHLTTVPAFADDYPDRPVRIVVPFAPSGGGDIIVRLVAAQLQARLGQPVIVENSDGAGGAVGSAVVAESAPDGYTLLMANVAPMAISVTIDPQLPYNPRTDFAPVSLLATFPNVLVVQPSLGVNTVQELVEKAKATPGELTFASAGNGSTTHLSGEFLKLKAGIDITHVPYRGGGPALTAVIGGEVSMYFSSLPAAKPHIEQGTLKALGLTSLERSKAAPDIPALAETFEGFEAVTWIGLVAPAGTPEAITERLAKEIGEIMKDEAIASKVRELGAEPVTDTPAEFKDYISSEINKWGDIVKAAKLEIAQ
ncbi:Bug family tripartite tricarboxylate transporter substrate binding protein [Shinella sp.]|uniref:Bug family tripartite tricarboxylate transporter substrate binding protein n=1 Tax=Shinella sp. TaxID=1870904 RepID=UPI003F6F9DCD